MPKLTGEEMTIDSERDRSAFGSFQTRVELIKNLTNQRAELLKRFCDRRSVVEQYLEEVMNIHLHLTSGEAGLCITYEIAPLPVATHEIKSNEFSVLVEVGKTLETQQRIKSIVRLEALDHCDVFVRKMLEKSEWRPALPRVPISLEALFTIIDRKVCSLYSSIGIKESEREDDIIETGAGVVDEFANKSHRLIVDITPEQAKSLQHIRIRIVGDSLYCRFPADLDQSFELFQFFPCPVYPELGLLKRAHADPLTNLLRESR